MLDMMSFAATLLPAAALTFPDVSPALVSIDLGFLGLGTFHLRWYALGYMAGIALAWWYASAMIRRPRLFGGTSPLTKDQLDDIMFWIIVGIILGGRFGYVLFYMVPYQFDVIAANPLTIFKIWDGGMAFHGGILGVTIALILFARRRKVSLLSIGDIAGVVAPIGIGLVRLANFVNGELWGRSTDVPWAMVFPSDPSQLARHPSQLYQAGLEGLAMMAIMLSLFWLTKARWKPGLLVGVFTAGIATARFINEFFRQPDAQLTEFAMRTGLSMGQWLSIPMILVGIAVIVYAMRNKTGRVDTPVASES